MALTVAEYLGIIGVEELPATMGELVPYILTVVTGVAVVCGVFRVVGKIADLLIGWRRW